MRRLLLLLLILLVGVGAGYLFVADDPSNDAVEILGVLEKTRTLAEAGDVVAAHAMGETYRLGLEVDKDPRQAYRWHLKAAEKGHNGSRLAVGRMLEAGDGVGQDYIQAIKWYRLAAAVGRLAEAEFSMGEMYFHGRGQLQDYIEAFDWYEKAATKGHPVAQHLLGGMYAEGWAVERDLIEAYKWYTLAMRARDKVIQVNPLYDPQRSRDMLVRKMNKFQIGRGEEHARDWKKSGS